MYFIIFLMLLFSNNTLFGISKPENVNQVKYLIDQVINRQIPIKDFTADVTVLVDVEGVKIPPVNAVYYFKQPNKGKIKSNGFALLPKNGIAYLPAILASNTLEYVGVGKYTSSTGIILQKIKAIPIDDNEILMATLYINDISKLIEKAEITTSSGQASVSFEYKGALHIRYAIPSSSEISFNIPTMMLPKSLTGDFSKESNKNKSKSTLGKATIRYNNLKINKGIDDSLFIDE